MKLEINEKNELYLVMLLIQEFQDKIHIEITKLQPQVEYIINNKQIITTTTKTLENTSLQDLESILKNIQTNTHIIIIKNTEYIQKNKIKQIGQHTNINIHITLNKIETVKRIIEKEYRKTKEIEEYKDIKHDYNIIKEEKDYYIVDKETKEVYGPYKNKKYLNLVLRELKNNSNITNAEEKAKKQYYQYITMDQYNTYVRYRITIHKRSITRTRTLKQALQIRDISLELVDTDEETICQMILPEYNEPLPPAPWISKKPYKNMIQIKRKKKKMYIIQKNTKKIKAKIGPFSNIELAKLIQNKLENNKWDKKTIKYIQDMTKKIKKQDRYIYKRKYYQITRNKKIIYKNKNINMTRYIRDKLEENNWNTNKIQEYEEQYEKQKHKKQLETKDDYIKARQKEKENMKTNHEINLIATI